MGDGVVEVDLRALVSDVETPGGLIAFSVGGAVHGTVELPPGRAHRTVHPPAADYIRPTRR